MEGFGFYLPDKDQMAHATTEQDILSYLSTKCESKVLFHHRNPTSTKNVKNACHPFSTKDFFERNYVLVHNGHISNHATLRKEHEAMGISYVSRQPDDRNNDSEALLWDIALYLEGRQDKLKATGAYAFIIYQHDRQLKKQKPLLHFGRNTNPLMMQFNKNLISLASKAPFGTPAVEAKSNTLYTFDYETCKLTHKDLDMPSYATVYTPTPPPATTYSDSPTGQTRIGFNTGMEDIDTFMQRVIEEQEKRAKLQTVDVEERAAKFVDYYMEVANEDPYLAKQYIQDDAEAGERMGETFVDENNIMERALEMLDDYIMDMELAMEEDFIEGEVVEEDKAPVLHQMGFVVQSKVLAQAIKEGKKSKKKEGENDK